MMNNIEQIKKKQRILKIAPFIISGALILIFSVFLSVIFFILHDKIWVLFAIGFIIGQILIAMGYIKFYKK